MYLAVSVFAPLYCHPEQGWTKMAAGVTGEVAWTAALAGPVFVPIALHSFRFSEQDSAKMAAIVTPQHGRTTALDVRDGSLLAKGSDDVQHTAASAVILLASGRVPLPSGGLC